MRSDTRFNERFTKALSVRENYDTHKRKLSELSKKAGPYAAINRSVAKLDEIRVKKQTGLVRARNKKLQDIDKLNCSLFSRLMESQEIGRNTYVANATIAFLKQSSTERVPASKPYFLRKMETNQEENEKLFTRLTKLKPTINNDKIRSDFELSRQRKQRLSRFQGNSLKNSKLIQRQINKRNTSLSSRGIQKSDLNQSIKDTKSTATVYSKQPRRSNSLYNHHQILKNKIQQPNILMRHKLRQLQRISFRPFHNELKSDLSKFMDENVGNKETRFFATEIQNLRRGDPHPPIKSKFG